VVDDPAGTAHAAFYHGAEPRLPGIVVGGKTGTAEFEKRAGKKTTMGRHAWFVGFARSGEFQPRTLAYAVLVEDVRRGATGGHVCAPVACDLIDRILPKRGQQPREQTPLWEQFYRQIRPHFGPLGPVFDWLKQRLGGK